MALLPVLLARLAHSPGTAGRLVMLPALLPEMSVADGPRLSLSPELRNEALYLRGDLGPPARLRALVARASSAEWVLDGSVLRLERPSALRKRLLEEERATRAAGFRAALPARPEALPKDPEGRAAARLLNALTPAALATLPPVGVVRFLGRGGNGLLPLPFDATPILAAYRAEAAAGGGARIAGGLDGSGLGSRYGAILAGGEPGLTAERTPYGLAVVRLYAVAPSGEAALVATAEVATSLKDDAEGRWPRASSTVKLPFVAASPSDAVMAALIAPGTEPLALSAEPFLDRLADGVGETRPVVLDLPDDAASLSAARASTVGADARLLGSFVAVEEAGGVVVGRPRLPVEASAGRFPRAELAAWSRLLAQPAVTLDETADLAARVGDLPVATGLEGALAASAGLAHDPTYPYSFAPEGRERLRFWWSLPVDARAALDAGRAVEIGALPSEAQTAGVALIVRGAGRLGSGPLFIDRDGAPRATLAWTLRPAPSALVVENRGRQFVYDAAGLGTLLGEQEKGHLLDPAFGYPDLRRSLFRPALRLDRAYGFVYAPSPAPPVAGTLGEVRLGDGAAGAWPALPPEILGPLRRALDAVRSGG